MLIQLVLITMNYINNSFTFNKTFEQLLFLNLFSIYDYKKTFKKLNAPLDSCNQ